MVRLSEALAKLECVDEVTVKHVREAKRLLQKSIITVEQPDVNLEEGMGDGNLGMDIDEPPPLMAALNALDDNNDAPPPTRKLYNFLFLFLYSIYCIRFLYLSASNGTQELPKKKLTMSFEEYKNLSNMLILYMRNEESRVESEGIFFYINMNIV